MPSLASAPILHRQPRRSLPEIWNRPTSPQWALKRSAAVIPGCCQATEQSRCWGPSIIDLWSVLRCFILEAWLGPSAMPQPKQEVKR